MCGTRINPNLPDDNTERYCTCSIYGEICAYHASRVPAAGFPLLGATAEPWRDAGLPGDPLCEVCQGTGNAWGRPRPDLQTGFIQEPLIPCPVCQAGQLDELPLGEILEEIIRQLEELNDLVKVLDKWHKRDNR